MFSALLKFLFPHEKNNYRAHALHPFSVFLFVGVFCLFQVVAYVNPSLISKAYSATTITPGKIIELTNQKRIEQGLSPLKENPVLDKSAQLKGADMLAQDYWAHNAPDGTTPWHFFKEAGYEYRFAGENLARNFVDSSDVINAWIASPTHKENLFSPKYEEIGVAVFEGTLKGEKTVLVVQHFGTSLDSTFVPVTGQTPQSPGTILGGLVEAEKSNIFSKFGNLFSLTRSFGLLILGFFIFVLIADWFVIHTKGISRHTSRSSAHILFLIMVIVAVLVMKGGIIL